MSTELALELGAPRQMGCLNVSVFYGAGRVGGQLPEAVRWPRSKQRGNLKLKNPWTVFIAILALLAVFALYRSGVVLQHHSLMEAFALLVIAVIFVKRIQKGP